MFFGRLVSTGPYQSCVTRIQIYRMTKPSPAPSWYSVPLISRDAVSLRDRLAASDIRQLHPAADAFTGHPETSSYILYTFFNPTPFASSSSIDCQPPSDGHQGLLLLLFDFLPPICFFSPRFSAVVLAPSANVVDGTIPRGSTVVSHHALSHS